MQLLHLFLFSLLLYINKNPYFNSFTSFFLYPNLTPTPFLCSRFHLFDHMDMSNNSDEINSIENQQVPTLKDPKGCLDITSNHQKDDDDKKLVILHQDPKESQDITIGHQKDHDETKKKEILHQNPKGCQDITVGQHKDDDANKIVILQQDPKGCQDITMDDKRDVGTNKIVILHQDIAQGGRRQEDNVVNETVVLQQPVDEDKVLPEDDDDGFKTPTSLESKIPILTTCPPAPKPKCSGNKRKASSRRGQRTIRVWIDYHHRDSGRFWPENQETYSTTPRRNN
ncbi:hypothetical protein HAX54_036032 [Datura stramonium]|uniref:Uncharacterized protein n=1 Tax=Datura stramonium TaxID=4076 RepID=A0ABS8VGD0_DATST|nr:hypothetical protein [Datura stramonium]